MKSIIISGRVSTMSNPDSNKNMSFIFKNYDDDSNNPERYKVISENDDVNNFIKNFIRENQRLMISGTFRRGDDGFVIVAKNIEFMC